MVLVFQLTLLQKLGFSSLRRPLRTGEEFARCATQALLSKQTLKSVLLLGWYSFKHPQRSQGVSALLSTALSHRLRPQHC